MTLTNKTAMGMMGEKKIERCVIPEKVSLKKTANIVEENTIPKSNPKITILGTKRIFRM